MTPTSAAGDKDKAQRMPSVVEFEPPLACVRRILKNALPSSTNVGKDASAAFARACGIFIIYVTACANDFAREHKRQTITATDVLAAIKELDFDEFSPAVQSFLESYRATEKSKKDAKAAKKKEAPHDDHHHHHHDNDQQQQQQAIMTTKEKNAKAAAADDDDHDHDDDDDDEEEEDDATGAAVKEDDDMEEASSAVKRAREDEEDDDEEDDDGMEEGKSPEAKRLKFGEVDTEIVDDNSNKEDEEEGSGGTAAVEATAEATTEDS